MPKKMRCLCNTDMSGNIHIDLTPGKLYPIISRETSMDRITYIHTQGDSGEDTSAPIIWFSPIPSPEAVRADIRTLGALLQKGEARIIGRMTSPQPKWVVDHKGKVYTVSMVLRPSWKRFYNRVEA